MNIHVIVWWKVKVLVCQGVSAISPTPILPTYYHSEAGPYHSEAGPYHSEAGPYHSEAGPYHSETGPYYSEAGPYHSEAGPYYSEKKVLNTQYRMSLFPLLLS